MVHFTSLIAVGLVAAAVPLAGFAQGVGYPERPVTIVALPHVQAGTVVPLAVTSVNRLAQLPDVPTMAEAGFAQIAVDGWTGYLAPAGTPEEIVAKLSDAFVEATNSPEIQERLKSYSLTPAPLAYREFDAFLTEQYAYWGDMISKAGVTLEE